MYQTNKYNYHYLLFQKRLFEYCAFLFSIMFKSIVILVSIWYYNYCIYSRTLTVLLTHFVFIYFLSCCHSFERQFFILFFRLICFLFFDSFYKYFVLCYFTPMGHVPNRTLTFTGCFWQSKVKKKIIFKYFVLMSFFSSWNTFTK